MSNFRKITLQKLAGNLTNFVKKELGKLKSSFKEAFLKLPPGLEREKLIYEQVIKSNLKANLIPVTIDGPAGIKITYSVMPDYITIDGIRIPMAGKTAQKVADHFKMKLPTDKMSDQIWEAADVKLRPAPLSSGGRIGGKYYSGKEVVKSKIGDSDSAVAYSEMIEEQLKEKGKKGLIAGHMKSVIMPLRPGKLGLYGWRGEKGDTIQKSPITSHDTSIHTEYGAGTRLVDRKITVTLPNGKIIKTTMDEVMNHPKLYKYISQVKGINKY